MTTNKNFKRLVRTRMQKTGESYTAARANLVLAPTLPRSHAPTPSPDFATLAGMSDASVKKATGCTWEKWVFAFDKVEAHTWPHRTIVEYAHEKFKTPDWWAQMVVVGYERIKGLRNIGERRGGGYEATRSKVVAVPVAKLFRAFLDKRTRNRWLPGVNLSITSATPGKYLHAIWPDGTKVDVGFTSKAAAKSSVALAHSRLKDKADAERRKAFWSERFAALEEMLVPMRKRKTA